MSDELKILDYYIDFATKVYSKTGSGDDKNFLFSPLSLSLGLSTLLVGSRRSSESELKHLLSYVRLPCGEIHKNNLKLLNHLKAFTSKVDFKFFNRLFIKDGVTPNKDFVEFLKNNYKVADVASVNFEDHEKAAKAINDWVDEQLKLKFKKQIVPQIIGSDFRMLLVNALYFKGDWFKKFDKYLTKRADFYLADGSVTQVNMMHLTNRKFKFKQSAAGLDASVCEFPFIGEELSMSIILPAKSSSLAVVESQLTPEVLKDALEEYNFAVKVNVHVPQFRIEESTELSEVLKNLDAPHLFNGFRTDFSGIAPSSQELFVSRVFNKLVIEVDEEGSEATATSGTGATNWKTASAIGQGAENFNCNRPFLFIIHDLEYRIPLIIGKFTKPDPL